MQLREAEVLHQNRTEEVDREAGQSYSLLGLLIGLFFLLLALTLVTLLRHRNLTRVSRM